MNDLTLECYEVLSDGYIVLHVDCDSEKSRNIKECPESVEEI